ncbi:3-oxoacyl-[acyl-carrier-protein] synthase 2 [compost metagenome]
MRNALRSARLQPGDIQHLNAHATSTPVGDRGELAAIREVFGAKASAGADTGTGPSVTATKSALGHMLGAAGGAAAIFTVLALRDQVAPPVLNLENPDPLTEGLDLIRGEARPQHIEHAMLNGFGFGGVNATLILKRYTG